MIYTVTLNPAIDCTMELSEYVSNRVNRAESEILTAGGKGINMSVILSRLGIETKALGFVGGDTGKLLCRLLDECGCPHAMTEINGGLTRVNVKLRTESEETEINGKGPDISHEELGDFVNQLTSMIKDGDTLILAGSVPTSVPNSVYADIMKLFFDRDVRIVADTSGETLAELLEMRPFLIKPNNYELGELCGCEIKTRQEAVKEAKKVQEMGARNILVSLAGEGAVLVSEDGNSFEIEAPTGRVKNSVGAGDSMLAGFLAGLEIYGDFMSALKLGTASGSATAFSDFLAEKDEILELFNSMI